MKFDDFPNSNTENQKESKSIYDVFGMLIKIVVAPFLMLWNIIIFQNCKNGATTI